MFVYNICMSIASAEVFGVLAWAFALLFLLSFSFLRWNIIIISLGQGAAGVCLELNQPWLGLAFGFKPAKAVDFWSTLGLGLTSRGCRIRLRA